MEQITKIAAFILESFIHIWPYLLISIPFAVAVKFTGAAKFITKIMSKNPLISILLATIVGAFSPFCSCGVIPVIASLLIGGVPLGPVMSFWIASPAMDPEIFFLSVATIGWNLSVWRLAATFFISLAAGYITHFAILKGYIDKEVLRQNPVSTAKNTWKNSLLKIKDGLRLISDFKLLSGKLQVQEIPIYNSGFQTKKSYCVSNESSSCDVTKKAPTVKPTISNTEKSCNSCEVKTPVPISLANRLTTEIWKATIMVVKFMSLAFLINALIQFYVPQEFISGILGGKGSFSVIIATLIGIPAYTTNLTTLPLISGLLSLGMNPGAALAFLIAGPTTTLPAMAAVWGLAKKKIFLMYISFSLFGAVLFGFLYNFIS
ncbi:MAG: hypothetical protein CVU00_00910 [Bacteroidetes bacterium HGW-Bacteroidetes-17]|jgi:hypothetical protein|nr:MAG: hypothetical protein CVU00_00910 [Bacteroidetes bacterium HGW-Bacteroidetes-17]